MVTAIQLMRLFRNAMTVSKIFSSTEANGPYLAEPSEVPLPGSDL